MNFRYIFGAIVTAPLLPLMYFQGKKIKKSVPVLPEATGIEGVCKGGDKGDLNIIFIGESTIAGVGVATHEEGLAGTFAASLATETDRNVYWKVYAKNGYTAKKMAYKIVPKITENKLDLIVIGVGGNDAFTLNTPKKWRADVSNLISVLKEKFEETPIFFLNMPPIKEFPAFTPLIKFSIGNLVEIFGEELQKIIPKFTNVYFNAQVITLDFWIKKLSNKNGNADFFSDGVHPSKLTYQTWAKDAVEFLLENEQIYKKNKYSKATS